MIKVGTWAALVATSLGAAVSVHAAPSSPSPSPTLRPGTLRSPAATLPSVSAEALPVEATCGQPLKQPVKVINKTSKSWTGTVSVNVGRSEGKGLKVTVGPNETKTVEVTSSVAIACAGPFKSPRVRVWNDASNNALYERDMRPTEVKAELGFSPPAASEPPQPWLRRVWLKGTCGGQLAGTMGLHTFAAQAQAAKVKLSIGATTKEETVQVLSSNTLVTVSAPLDCQANGPFPSLDYALLDGRPASGKLAAAQVTLEP